MPEISSALTSAASVRSGRRAPPWQWIASTVRRGAAWHVPTRWAEQLWKAGWRIGNPLSIRRDPRSPGYSIVRCKR